MITPLRQRDARRTLRRTVAFASLTAIVSLVGCGPSAEWTERPVQEKLVGKWTSVMVIQPNVAPPQGVSVDDLQSFAAQRAELDFAADGTVSVRSSFSPQQQAVDLTLGWTVERDTPEQVALQFRSYGEPAQALLLTPVHDGKLVTAALKNEAGEDVLVAEYVKLR